jgi:CubicO group peptidase (beta-lactamase class C family)
MNLIKPETVGLSSDRLKRISDLTKSYVGTNHFAGASSFVARRGEVVHFDCQGMMNLDTGNSIQEDTIFRIYSMTKPVTSVAAMILLERGLFQLDTPITKFLPEFKDMEVFVSGTVEDYKTVRADRDITIVDLMTHTSGLTYDFLGNGVVEELYQRNGLVITKDEHSFEGFLKLLGKMPLHFSPGTKWNYSLSTDVLGYLIEVVSGKPLNTFFKEEIFEPLGMVDTDFYVPESKWNRFATTYIHKSMVAQTQRNAFPDKTLFPYDSDEWGVYHKLPLKCAGGGGLVSTIPDFYKFTEMLLNKGRGGKDNILSSKSIELMTSNFLPMDVRDYAAFDLGATMPAGYGFGLGFAIMLDPTKAHYLGTPGEYAWSGAAHTSFFVDPREELIGIYMTQVFPSGYYNILNQFKQAVYQSIIV